MMKRMMLLAFAMGMALPAQAETLELVSGGAVEPGLRPAVAAFEKESGDTVHFRFATGPEIKALIASGTGADMVIAPEAVATEMAGSGKLAPGTEPVGRVGIGVAVRSGVKAPDVSTLASLTAAMKAADEIDYNVATTGLVLRDRFGKLGLLDMVEAKAQHFPNGEEVVKHLSGLHAGNQIGFGAITEIKLFATKGVTYVGPVPAELQKYSTYVAAAMPGKADQPSVVRFMRFLASPRAKAIFVAAGVDQPKP
jgi:molybdate transport system substrate-binding protein